MYQTAIGSIKNSIFPIFHTLTQGPNTTIGINGTGFFISNQGHFLTALHVITGIAANAVLQYRGNIPAHIVNPPVPITEMYRDPLRDIYLGRINVAGQAPVQFSLDKPNVGKSVCLCGYPLAQLSQNPNGSINVSAVRQYWQPTFVIDSVTIANPGQNYVAIMTQDTSLNGMSGGPVFGPDGIVVGVDTAFITREIRQGDKPSILVYNGIALENASIADVYAMIA